MRLRFTIMNQSAEIVRLVALPWLSENTSGTRPALGAVAERVEPDVWQRYFDTLRAWLSGLNLTAAESAQFVSCPVGIPSRVGVSIRTRARPTHPGNTI
jgi:hypothetical protein